jgi:hypothetical protein
MDMAGAGGGGGDTDTVPSGRVPPLITPQTSALLTNLLAALHASLFETDK